MNDPTGEPIHGAPEGWTVVEGRLHREFAFADFAEAWAFMGRVAEQAERLDHHPDWSNSWNVVVVDLISHDEAAITARDLELAHAIERCR
jgi:4a-hydroxytetrahydrobiopterin dehydratase